jgi:uncharacterized protein YfdQ (DUF2303 family)
MNTTDQQNIAQTLAEHMKAPQLMLDETAAHRYTVALPPGWTHHQIDEEKFQSHPRRATGKFHFDELDSFAAYLARHASRFDTTAWCKADFPKGELSFAAVLNDHDSICALPGHRDWTAHWEPAKSEEWKTWTGSDNKPMTQVEFAYFIERNLKDIATGEGLPTGTQMLQMATNMEITQDSKFKSQAKLQSGGVRLTYIDDSDEATEKAMEIFSKFAIGLQAFRGGDSFRIEARLRYRLTQGKLAFWYELIRPDVTLEAASRKLVDQLREKIADTGVPLFFGQPTENRG